MSDLRAFAIAPVPAASPASSSAAAARIGWGTAPPASAGDDAAPVKEEEEDEGRGLLQASASNKTADSSAAQRRSKSAAAVAAAAAPSTASSSSHRSSAAPPADIALESSSQHHAAISIAPSPLRRVQPTLPARPFNPLDHERNQRKRWYWSVAAAVTNPSIRERECMQSMDRLSFSSALLRVRDDRMILLSSGAVIVSQQPCSKHARSLRNRCVRFSLNLTV